MALRGNGRIAEHPATRVLRIVTESNTLEAHGSIRGIVEFEPARVVAVVILEIRIIRRNFGENNREIAHVSERSIDRSHLRVFARERAIMRTVILLGRRGRYRQTSLRKRIISAT